MILHLKNWRTLFSISCLFLFQSIHTPSSRAQSYGIDHPEPIGAYLNNVFPHSAPISNGAWRVEVAFTNITFNQPVFMLPYPGTNRLLMVEKPGRIVVFPDRRNAQASDSTVFLDIRSRVFTISDSGMSGFAFHPEFGQPGSTNRGFVYVAYKWRPNPDFGANGDWAYWRLSRFTVPDGTMAADPNSELVMVQQFDRQMWHDAGCMLFGQDGFLYFSSGDEGGVNDEFNSVQKLNERLMGGVFRIDVNKDLTRSHPIRRQPFRHPNQPAQWPENFTTNYFVPNDNPFVNTNGTVLEEFYAHGFRNPYRISHDPATGLIWVGDVGQSTREEVDVLVAGANYQWNFREGTFIGPKAKPVPVIGTEKPPLWDYGRNEGGCIIGGYVYRGSEHAPTLTGKYICVDNVSGRIWALTSDGITLGAVDYLTSMPAGSVFGGATSCALDVNGEIYFLKFEGNAGELGRIYKLARDTAVVPEPPPLLSQTGAFTNLSTLATAPGIHPYDVNSPLWSDGAKKWRWMAVPNDGSHDSPAEKIVFSPTNDWRFPVGTVFIKHFELPVDERNPSITKRLETRFIVMDETGGAYGVTYKWRADQSDADLLPGLDVANFVVTNSNSSTRTQTWTFPSRLDCMTCHNPNARYVLGLKTHQLNGKIFYPKTGRIDHQLRALGHLGLFTTDYHESQIPYYLKSCTVTNESVSLTDRVRSYLDANCSQCHRPGGVNANFDARFITPLEQQKLIYGNVLTYINDPQDRVIRPGDLLHSILHNRDSRVGTLQMPPIAKSLVDNDAISTLAQWIGSLPPGPGVTLTLTPVVPIVSGPFNVAVKFTESVTNLMTNNFMVANGSISAMSGSGSNYSLIIQPQTEGVVTVQLPAGQVIGSTGYGNYSSNPLSVEYRIVDSNLVTWLRFDEGSGLTATDLSGFGNHGSFSNMTATAWVPGLSGGALDFDGVNDYLRISNVLSGNFTISLWIKTTQQFPLATNTSGGAGIVWSDVNGTANDFILGATRNAAGLNRLSFQTGNPNVAINGVTDISSGQWTHIAAARRTTGNLKIFVNGKLDSFGIGSTAPLSANPNILIGGNTINNLYFDGLIDDLRLYNRALSDAEIAALAVAGDPFTSWAATHLAGVPPAQATMNADPDSDGLANLLEYAFGMDPKQPEFSPFEINLGADSFVRLSHPRRTDTDRLRYTVMVSADLETWESAGTFLTLENVDHPPGQPHETVTLRFNDNQSQTAFFRLFVEYLSP